MHHTLGGKVVVVTGSARGMGAEHARELVAAGAKVVVTDVLDQEGRALVKTLGAGALYTHLDVTSEDDWAETMARANAMFGRIDALVNNAGVLTHGTLETLDRAAWQRTLDINVTGAWLGMRAVLPSLRTAGGGSIVNVSSTAGLVGYAGLGAYVASKWALRGLTKTAALEFARDRVRVNLLHPGPIRTPMIANVPESVAAHQAIPRIGEPEEVTAMLLFLLADATYSTGHEFVVDGGATLGSVDDVLAGVPNGHGTRATP